MNTQAIVRLIGAAVLGMCFGVGMGIHWYLYPLFTLGFYYISYTGE